MPQYSSTVPDDTDISIEDDFNEKDVLVELVCISLVITIENDVFGIHISAGSQHLYIPALILYNKAIRYESTETDFVVPAPVIEYTAFAFNTKFANC